MRVAIALILLAVLCRVFAAWSPAWSNFSPLMALAFTGAIYLRRRYFWLIPFIALTASDLYLNHYHAHHFHATWSVSETLLRLACFASALGLGALVARRKTWGTLFGGAVLGALLFYVVTNTASWLADPTYAGSFGGWVQALTIGHPEFPPTWYFFRNSLLSDLLFTGGLALFMEYRARQAGQPSLLGSAPARALPRPTERA